MNRTQIGRLSVVATLFALLVFFLLPSFTSPSAALLIFLLPIAVYGRSSLLLGTLLGVIFGVMGDLLVELPVGVTGFSMGIAGYASAHAARRLRMWPEIVGLAAALAASMIYLPVCLVLTGLAGKQNILVPAFPNWFPALVIACLFILIFHSKRIHPQPAH